MKKEIKVAIINGENSDIDGWIEYFYIDDNEYYHSYILREYVIHKYDILDLSDIDLNNANSMALFLREKGDIVFLNTTTYINRKPSKHGRTSMIFMPDMISSNQRESLLNFNDDIKSYDEVQVYYNFIDRTSCSTMFTKNKEQVKTIIDDVLDTYPSVKEK